MVCRKSSCNREIMSPKCVNCTEEHEATSKTCTERQWEMAIMELQQKEKIERWQAIRKLEGQGRSEKCYEEQGYERYLYVQAETKCMRKLCPFKVEKYLSFSYEVVREDITAQRTGYIIKTTSPAQPTYHVQ